MVRFPVDYSPGQPGEELEGIDIWDLSDGRAPNIRGQIHVMMGNDYTLGDDLLYFKHYEVTDPWSKAKL